MKDNQSVSEPLIGRTFVRRGIFCDVLDIRGSSTGMTAIPDQVVEEVIARIARIGYSTVSRSADDSICAMTEVEIAGFRFALNRDQAIGSNAFFCVLTPPVNLDGWVLRASGVWIQSFSGEITAYDRARLFRTKAEAIGYRDTESRGPKLRPERRNYVFSAQAMRVLVGQDELRHQFIRNSVLEGRI